MVHRTTAAQHVRFGRALVAMNLKANLAHRAAFVMQVGFMALNNAVFFVFWWALLQHVQQIRGWTLADVQVLFGVVAAAFGLTVSLAGGVRHLGRVIDDGELDTLLTQPRPVLLYALGMRMQPAGIGDALSGIAFVIWSQQVSWRTWPLLLLVIVASAVVFTAIGVLFFCSAFWLGRSETIARQAWDLLVTFSLYPESLFGGWMRAVLFTVLPAGFVGYVPVRVITHPTVWNVGAVVTAAAAYALLAVVVFNRGLRRYASGSRFGTFG